MTRPLPSGGAVAACLLGAAVVAGCGAKAPPLPPLIIEPARIAPLEVSRLDDVVYVEFEVPSSNSTGDVPADIVRVEVYALTTRPAEGEEEEFSEDWLEAATLIDSVPVRPPLPPGMDEESAESAGVEGEPAGEDEPAGKRKRAPASQGDEITVVERLVPEAFVPVTVGEEDEEEEDDDEGEDDELEEERRPIPFPNAAPPFPPPIIRSYVAFGVSSRGRGGGGASRTWSRYRWSKRRDRAAAPAVEYSESRVSVTWEAPDTLRLPVQSDDDYDFGDEEGAEPAEPPLESTPNRRLGRAVAVRRLRRRGPSAWCRRRGRSAWGRRAARSSHSDADVAFGETRCYAVRVLDAVGELEIRGPGVPRRPASC